MYFFKMKFNLNVCGVDIVSGFEVNVRVLSKYIVYILRDRNRNRDRDRDRNRTI